MKKFKDIREKYIDKYIFYCGLDKRFKIYAYIKNINMSEKDIYSFVGKFLFYDPNRNQIETGSDDYNIYLNVKNINDEYIQIIDAEIFEKETKELVELVLNQMFNDVRDKS